MINKTYNSQICRICGKYQINFIETGRVVNGYKLYQCRRCKTFMVLPSDADKMTSTGYDDLFATGEYEMHRRSFELLSKGKVPLEFHRQQLLKRIENQTTGRNLVEIGGGVGSFGVFCKERSWNYVDYDISSVAVEYAKKLNLNAHVIENLNQFELPSADVVAMWEVIEHIWNVHEYLENIKKSLKNGGVLILSTPNYLRRGYRLSNNWGKLSASPVHVNFFTKESLVLVLNSAGFSTVQVFQPKLYRPSPNLSSIFYNFQIALGVEPTKTLYVVAR